MGPPHKPTREALLAAHGRGLPDVIDHDLAVLFCGINPGLYSAAVQHHFARPGNRFWPALHQAGFTPRRLHPHEELEMLALGYGLTNLVDRATAAADELTPGELKAGGRRLAGKARHYQPRYLAILGIGAYQAAFGRRKATLGLQEERLGSTHVWLLPSPSGLNAHYQPEQLAGFLRELRRACG